MALRDDDLLAFDASGLAMADAGDARRLLHEHGDVFRAQLVAALWLDGYRKRRAEWPNTVTGEPLYEAGVEDALREIAAYLRQGDFLPGGALYEDEVRRDPR